MTQIITRKQDAVQENWQKQLANALTCPQKLLEQLEIDPGQYLEQPQARRLFPLRVPISFVNRMEKGNINDPLLQQVLPVSAEFNDAIGFSADPLEEQTSAIPGLLHKYQSRVLLIVRGGCAINCRYCFRRHFPYQNHHQSKADWQHSFDYIQQHPEVNEVILSGGDPLMADDAQLGWLLERLAQIPQITRLRIHSRLPVVLPSRITQDLCLRLQALAKPVVMVLHINHPHEINNELRQALTPLSNAGVTLLNQGVLLKGINDNADTLVGLSEALFSAKILPYYLFLLDKVAGAAHFEVADAQAKQIMHDLHRRLPGYLVPRLSREQAGQNSKTLIDLQLHQE